MVPSFNSMWVRIVAFQGQTLRTVKGLPFIYEVKGQFIRVSPAKQNLSRTEFEKAYKLLPLNGPGEINSIVRGPAYIYAILTDTRISGSASQVTPKG